MVASKYSIVPLHLTVRVCTKCRLTVPAPRFGFRPDGRNSGFLSRCQDCRKLDSRAYRQRQLAKDPESWRAKVREDARRWRTKNPERKAEIDKQRKKRNPEKMRRQWNRVDNRRRAARANVEARDVLPNDELLAKQGGRCANCRVKGKSVEWNLDHVMPLALGGVHAPHNVQMLCAKCNRVKSAKHPLDFAREQGRLL